MGNSAIKVQYKSAQRGGNAGEKSAMQQVQDVIMDEENHALFSEKFNTLSAAQAATVKGAFGDIDVTDMQTMQDWLEDSAAADFDGIMATLNGL